MAKLSETNLYPIMSLGFLYGHTGQIEKARDVINRLQALTAERYVAPFCFGLVYLGMDEYDQAYYWFNQAYNEHDFHLHWIWTLQNFWEESTQQDPRYRELLDKVNLGHLAPRTYPLIPEFKERTKRDFGG